MGTVKVFNVHAEYEQKKAQSRLTRIVKVVSVRGLDLDHFPTKRPFLNEAHETFLLTIHRLFGVSPSLKLSSFIDTTIPHASNGSFDVDPLKSDEMLMFVAKLNPVF